MNEKGGIIDDSVITKVTLLTLLTKCHSSPKVAEDDLYLVVNAGRRDVDLAHINAQLKQHSNLDVEMVVHNDRGLLALQGPSAAPVLQSLVDIDLSSLYFSNFAKTDIAGVPSWITRTGCVAFSSSISAMHRMSR